jgi:DNA (cytosine-5)-methyltransferase 1
MIKIDFILDDFAAGGGWEQGFRQAGSTIPTVGVEWDKAAVLVARANGQRRIRGDVRKVTGRIAKILKARLGTTWLYVASPPCQTFSAAGKGAGREHLDSLLLAVRMVGLGYSPEAAIAQVSDEALDERSVLVLHPLQIIVEHRPTLILLEQVKEALPVWKEYAAVLRGLGYAVRVEVIKTEKYGVAQSRRRAVLSGSLIHDEAPWPTATHSEFYPRNKAKRDEGVLPFVTMAQALGWADPVKVISNYSTGGDTSNPGVRYGDEPAATITSKTNRNKVIFGDVVRANGTLREVDTEPAGTIPASADNGNFRFFVGAGRTGEGRPRNVDEAPAATLTGKGTAYFLSSEGDWTPGQPEWTEQRPSPTIVGSFAPDVVAAPGYRKAGDPPRQKTPGSVRITVQQAGILQSFPADYLWVGSKSDQHQIVGNAVPPKVGEVFLTAILQG